MKFSLLILAVCLCAASAQQAARGRERLRELVQKARNGDLEARNILAQRRRKIVNKTELGPAARNIQQEAVAGGVRGSAQASRSRRPVSGRVSRPRSRGGARQHQVVTTPAPVFEPTTIEAFAPTTFVPEFFQAEEEVFTTQAPIAEPQVVNLKPAPFVPSLFRPAQFGPGGRGVQAGADPVAARNPLRESRVLTSRNRVRLEPHTAIQRGLEISTRTEVIERHADEETPANSPPQTTRRYSYFDEAGNYVFGYEATDGSFKEEIRGLDCIVNGKYGYVDPEGIRREFTYVSGNKCDPTKMPGTEDGVTIAPNDQFLHQTSSRQLNAAELSKMTVNRRRQNLPQQIPQQVAPQRVAAQPRQRVTSAPRPRVIPSPARATEAPRAVRTQNIRAQPNQERFPVPAFLGGAKPASRPKKPLPQAKKQQKPKSSVPSLFQPAQFSDQLQVAVPRVRVTTQKPVTHAPPNLTPTNVIPSLFQPAQFSDQLQVAAPRVRVTTQKPVTHAPPNLTPGKFVPSMFQPAQFGAGGRGVQAAADTFNFDQEFSQVFNSFPQSQPGPVVRTRPQTTPRPTQAPSTRPRPTTRAPTPAPTASPIKNVPSHFQPAQFASNRPAPTPVQQSIDAGSSFTLAPSSGTQLVFDATTGQFRHVPIASAHGGRPLPLPSKPRKSPLPPVPTAPTGFEHFFANFQG